MYSFLPSWQRKPFQSPIHRSETVTGPRTAANMAYCSPRPEFREIPVQPHQTAVLFIDTQNFNCHRKGACFQACTADELEGPKCQYWWQRLAECIPRLQQLQQACRAAKVEVIYTVIQSLTQNGRDRGLDYKISGFHVPPGSWDAQVLDELQPGNDEMVLPKTSSSVFISTNIHYLLQNLDVKQLILVGCVTDQCVAHAVKDACDLGYLVTLVTDCCATYTAERHESACSMISGYCRQRTLEQLLPELQQQQQEQH